LGGVGEVAVGPDEFSDIWLKCAGRSLLTTNIGSRVNVRHYLPAPVVTIPEGDIKKALTAAKAELEKTFKPFLKTPDEKPRPLVVFVQFKRKAPRTHAQRKFILRALLRHTRSGKMAAPRVHTIGFSVRIGWGRKGRNAATKAIDLADEVGIRHVLIDGVVRKAADRTNFGAGAGRSCPGVRGPQGLPPPSPDAAQLSRILPAAWRKWWRAIA
jgi:hypothetical protein